MSPALRIDHASQVMLTEIGDLAGQVRRHFEAQRGRLRRLRRSRRSRFLKWSSCRATRASCSALGMASSTSRKSPALMRQRRATKGDLRILGGSNKVLTPSARREKEREKERCSEGKAGDYRRGRGDRKLLFSPIPLGSIMFFLSLFF